MSFTEAKHLDIEKVPVINISKLCDGTDPLPVAKALHKASTGLGFIYIKGHGIPKDVISSLREEGLTFFRNNEKNKEEVKITEKHRGWLGYGGAKMEDNAKADLKESFLWGYQDKDGTSLNNHPLRGNNVWPSFQPNLEKTSMKYFNYADKLARNLMRGFALGLDLEKNFFLKTCKNPLSRASLVYYPNQSPEHGKNQFGVSSHTDFGVLTVLCQDSVGGLQIQDINGEWFHAPPIEDTIIVNVADLLSRWTAGEYKSTPHRVVNNSGMERLSIVLAFDPDPETVIDPKDIFGKNYDKGEVSITCGEYLIWRFGKAFSYRK
jgi:isopenicillin N synthase-like dioxygenase